MLTRADRAAQRTLSKCDVREAAKKREEIRAAVKAARGVDLQRLEEGGIGENLSQATDGTIDTKVEAPAVVEVETPAVVVFDAAAPPAMDDFVGLPASAPTAVSMAAPSSITTTAGVLKSSIVHLYKTLKIGIATAGDAVANDDGSELDLEVGTSTESDICNLSEPSRRLRFDSLANELERSSFFSTSSTSALIVSTGDGPPGSPKDNASEEFDVFAHLIRQRAEEEEREAMENAPLDDRDPENCELDLNRIRTEIKMRITSTVRCCAKDWYVTQNRSKEGGVDVDLEQLSEDADRYAEVQVQLASPLLDTAMDTITATDVSPDEYQEAGTRRLFDAVGSAEERLGVAQIESLSLDLVQQSAKLDLKSLTPEDVIADVLEPKILESICSPPSQTPSSSSAGHSSAGDSIAISLDQEEGINEYAPCIMCHAPIPSDILCTSCSKPATCGEQCQHMAMQCPSSDPSGSNNCDDDPIDWAQYVETGSRPITSIQSVMIPLAISLCLGFILLATTLSPKGASTSPMPSGQSTSSRDLSITTTEDSSLDDSMGVLYRAMALVGVGVGVGVGVSWKQFVLRRNGYKQNSSSEGFRAAVAFDGNTMLVRGGGSMSGGTKPVVGRNTPNYRGAASKHYERQIVFFASEADRLGVNSSDLKVSHSIINESFDRLQQDVPGISIVFKHDGRLYKCNDTALKRQVIGDIKQIRGDRSKAIGAHLVPGAAGTPTPDKASTVCLGLGAATKSHFNGDANKRFLFLCREKAGDLVRPILAANRDPERDPVSIPGEAPGETVEDVLAVLESNNIDMAWRDEGAANFVPLTDDGKRLAIRSRIVSQIGSITSSTLETYRSPDGYPDPCADVSRPIIEAHRRSENAGQNHQTTLVVRTNFFSDEPCCKGDACKGSGYLSYRMNNTILCLVNPYNSAERMCRSCYQAQECPHNVRFSVCRHSECNGTRCTKHQKTNNCCMECHPALTITSRRRRRRRHLFNRRVASKDITEQEAQDLVHVSDAQIVTELGCSAEDWSSHLLGTFNDRYGTSFDSLGEIQQAGIDVEIDEIVGCCNWRLDELRYCFHWRNSQLLKLVDNRRKTRHVSPQEKQAKKDEIDGEIR